MIIEIKCPKCGDALFPIFYKGERCKDLCSCDCGCEFVYKIIPIKYDVKYKVVEWNEEKKCDREEEKWVVCDSRNECGKTGCIHYSQHYETTLCKNKPCYWVPKQNCVPYIEKEKSDEE